MTRPFVVLAATATVALLPAAAIAKDVQQAKVCGAEGCQTQTSAQDRKAVLAAIENGGPPTSPPGRRAAFYRVSVVMGDASPSDPQFRLLVVPGARRVQGPEGNWTEMDRFAYAAWQRVTRGVRPFPAARLPGIHTPAVTRPAASPVGGGTEWGLIGGIAAGSLALAVGAFALVVRRRRREPPGAPRTAPVS